jgi:hypothetical protein
MIVKIYNKYLRLTCEEASLLISKRQETKLTWQENFKLRFHTSVCDPCTRFAKQVAIMDASMAQFFSPNPKKSQTFSEERMKELKKMIEENE